MIQYDIKALQGTPNQVKVGILGSASVTFNLNNSPIISLNRIEVRQKKDGTTWVKWPQWEHPTKKKDNGYPETVAFYLPYPTKFQTNERRELEQQIINAVQNAQPFDNNRQNNRQQPQSQAQPQGQAQGYNNGYNAPRNNGYQSPPSNTSHASDEVFDDDIPF